MLKNVKTVENLTLEYVESFIKSVEYKLVTDSTYLCIITLNNDSEVHGKASCFNMSKFDEKIGKDSAYNDALDKLFEIIACVSK